MMNRTTPSASAIAGSVATSRIVVPRAHGSVLCLPDWAGAPSLLTANRALLSSYEADVQGMPLTGLREWTRQAILDEAVRYTSLLLGTEVSRPRPVDSLFVTGHQPELFHAGVWAKNFAVAGLARQQNGVALNLIVDNDTLESTRIRVPVGTQESPRIEHVPFDTDRAEQPWEDATIVDRACFREFGRRVASLVRSSWSYEPLISTSWDAAIKQAEASSRLCDGLTVARVAVERRLGLVNLEFPMSRVCETGPFRWFAAHLLAHLPRVSSLYNAAVREYRRAHRLRSQTHPVPELESRDGWIEAPFWLWREGDLQRDRPFVRQVGLELELRDSRESVIRLPLTPDRSAEMAVVALEELAARGYRLRTRALTTTLFVRLCLADVFVHGVGGAKYDAMTDRICEQFFGAPAPRFLTVSATMHLPLGGISQANGPDEQSLNHQLRDLRYNPDRHITVTAESAEAALVEEKRKLLAPLASRRPTALEHQRIAQINSELGKVTAPVERRLQSERDAARRQNAASSLRQSREFAWCLHRADELLPFLRNAFGL